MEGYLGFLFIDSHRAIALLHALGETAVVRHSRTVHRPQSKWHRRESPFVGVVLESLYPRGTWMVIRQVSQRIDPEVHSLRT